MSILKEIFIDLFTSFHFTSYILTFHLNCILDVLNQPIVFTSEPYSPIHNGVK